MVSFGGGDTSFTFKMLIFAMAMMILLPMFINIYCPEANSGATEDEVLDGYYQMTGQKASTKVSVWPLTGIYLPYSGGTYGYTEDGWLYGSEIKTYTPAQYGTGTPENYVVYKDDTGVFRYYADSADYDPDLGTGHRGSYHIATTQSDPYDASKPVSSTNYTVGDYVPYDEPGELYTAVNFDKDHMSSIFFMESSRTETDDGFFYYDYDGYRLAFQPISSYTAVDADGNAKPIIATTTSLSLIWYQYYTQSGVAGQLVLSGSSGGLAYLNAAQILQAFSHTTTTASFDMVFNGITMTVYIKIDPMYLSSGYTVEECYNAGWWSIMVTSLSADSSAYTGTDFSLNPAKMLDTVIDLFTFNYSDYSMSSWLGAILSLLISLPFYAALIAICLDHAYLWIAVGILGAIQALASLSIF